VFPVAVGDSYISTSYKMKGKEKKEAQVVILGM
jgi:hypothetical protein